MQIQVDADAQAVLEFMQRHVAANRVVSVAEALPQMARLLWGAHPQEPVSVLQLQAEKAIGLDRL